MKRLRLFLLVALSAFPLNAALFSEPTVAELQQKIDRLPADSRSRSKAALYSEIGKKHYQAGRMPEAAAAFATALESNGSKAMKRHDYLYLGKSYESSGRADKAVDAYRQALAYDSRNWRRHRDLGLLYKRVRLTDEAITELQAALALEPDEPTLHFDLGSVWREEGLYADAERALKRALALGHDKNRVNREMSFVLEGQGRFAEAAEFFEKTLGPSPSSPELARLIYLYALGHSSAAARAAVDRLRASGASTATVSFYDSLARLAAGGPENVLNLDGMDPSLRTLVEGALWHRMD